MANNNYNKELTIGIFGHYGNENLGDEAIIHAVIQNLKKRRECLKLYGLSINPSDTEKRHNIPAFPIRRLAKKKPVERNAGSVDGATEKVAGVIKEVVATKPSIKTRLKRLPLLGHLLKAAALILQLLRNFMNECLFLKESYKVARQLDLLMITGSNQFLDNFGGTMGFPYTLLKWSVLARMAGAKVAIVCVGAGPIYNGPSKRLIRMVLKLTEYISFRDAASQKLVQSFGFNGKSFVYPDLAHSLIIDLEKNNPANAPDKPVVGINPMPVYDSRYWYAADSAKYDAYVAKLTEFSSLLIEKEYPLFFYATQPRDENVIRDVVNGLNQVKKGMGDLVQVKFSRDQESFFQNLQSADILIATRFHGVLLGLYAEKAVLGICYHRKTDDLLTEYGQGDYSMVLEDMAVDEMSAKFHKLKQNMEHERALIREKNKLYDDALSEQYVELLALAEQR